MSYYNVLLVFKNRFQLLSEKKHKCFTRISPTSPLISIAAIKLNAKGQIII